VIVAEDLVPVGHRLSDEERTRRLEELANGRRHGGASALQRHPAAAGAVGAAGKKITKPEKTDLHLASQYRR
jgi:hypothetical protein